MKHSKKIVSYCWNCPFHHDLSCTRRWQRKFSSEELNELVHVKQQPPNWCPLREQPVLVKLRLEER